ncbi:hypothetical protein LCGC14_0288510 [marine sediment metagenome]|uniref:Uncharacterized protein n=1 Tax=marine sediment metagenome TaxID=412755 RepID=A0A0F9TYL4_9ZZZZ
MTHTIGHDTGIYRSSGTFNCDVCDEENEERVNIESAALIQICAECAVLAGIIGAEISDEEEA